MCLATAPPVLLLAEPLLGMGAGETHRMLALLTELKSSLAILLVQHDMDAVFRAADRITVMVNGTVIATGSPDEVRSREGVQTAHLGGHGRVWGFELPSGRPDPCIIAGDLTPVF